MRASVVSLVIQYLVLYVKAEMNKYYLVLCYN